MLPSFNPDEDTDLEDSSPKAGGFSDEFLAEFIQNRKAQIQARKLLEEMLFFLACQVASAGLALILFQYAVQWVVTCWLCLLVSWVPSMPALSEFNIQKAQEGWSIQIANRPVIILIKFASGGAVTGVTLLAIARELRATDHQIKAVREQIQAAKYPQIENYLPPYVAPVFLGLLGLFILGLVFKNFSRDSLD